MIPQFILFLSVAFLIFWGIHAYVFWRIRVWFGLKKQLWMNIIALGSFFVLIFLRSIESYCPDFLYVLGYGFFSLWMGSVFIIFWCALVYDLLRRFIRLEPRYWGWGILSLAGILIIYATYNGMSAPKVKSYDLYSPKITESIRVAQLTDVHVDVLQHNQFLNRSISIVNDQQPDFVLITGDLVDGIYDTEIYKALNNLKAPVYFVTGNHEIYPGLDRTLAVLKDTKVRILDDEAVDFGELQIIGLNYLMANEDITKTLSTISIDDDKYSILMHHAPNGLEEVAKFNIDLMLAGHTHNGQIFPFTYLVKLMFPRIKGFYEYENTLLYVSPGTGTWGPPMRLGSANEITIINLHPSK